MLKLDKLYINSASTIILQIYNMDFIEYKNQIFPNNTHIHLKSCDAVSSYHFTSPITGSNIPKQYCILNCCYDCPSMNSPYIESPEKLDCFFPAYLHQIKLHIFQNISKVLIHRLRLFKYKTHVSYVITYKTKKIEVELW